MLLISDTYPVVWLFSPKRLLETCFDVSSASRSAVNTIIFTSLIMKANKSVYGDCVENMYINIEKVIAEKLYLSRLKLAKSERLLSSIFPF